MKPSLIIILLLLSTWLVGQNRSFVIKGRIENYKPGEKIYLLCFGRTDSALVTDGKFIFSGHLNISNEPDENYFQSVARLVINHTPGNINFDIINSRSNLDMCTVYLELGITEIDIVDSARRAVIRAPAQNSGHYILDSIYIAYLKKVVGLSHVETKMFANVNLANHLNQIQIFKQEQRRDMWQFVETHPSSPVSLYVLKHNEEFYPDYDEIESYFEPLSTELKNTTFGKSYSAFIAGLKLTRIGVIAPEFTMNDQQNLPVSLTSFKGKYVLIDFWASWCSSCREENPNIVKAYNTFKNQDFAILGVSLDEKMDAWLNAIDKDQLSWKQVSDLKSWNNAAAQLYSVKAIPQNFLLDPQGRIIAKNLFGNDLFLKLSQIFTAKK